MIPCCVSIGNFDGVHIGHQSLLTYVNSYAHEHGLISCVITFNPITKDHLLSGERISIMSISDRIDEIKKYVNKVIVLDFNERLANIDCESFIEYLCSDLRLEIKYLILGNGFKFGKDRCGNIPYIRSIEIRFGFRLICIDNVIESDQIRVSSSYIRELLKFGKFYEVEHLLGRKYSISGTVIRGDRIGKKMGFPTANLDTDIENMLNIDGVYFVSLNVKSNDLFYDGFGIANIGYRPTINKSSKKRIEVHILNFSKDIYYSDVRIEFIEKIRDVIQFDSIVSLRSNIDDICKKYGNT